MGRQGRGRQRCPHDAGVGCRQATGRLGPTDLVAESATGVAPDTGTRSSSRMASDSNLRRTLEDVGPRLKDLRTRRHVTLSDLSRSTAISTSTLSRLETGQRRPSLELLLPIAQALRVSLDDLVNPPETGDPRIRLKPRRLGGNVILPLTQHPGPLQAYKIVIPHTRGQPEMYQHEGHEWLYVLAGQLRLIVDKHDTILKVGEAAEFETRLPHWFGSTGTGSVEVLSLLGRHGERVHTRSRGHTSAPLGA